MSEIRGTADSSKGESEAKLPRSEKHDRERGASGGWRWNDWKSKFMNQGDLSWRRREQGRSQSPRSSDEAANPRGAKGDRKVEA
jgi:hypothetical protein